MTGLAYFSYFIIAMNIAFILCTERTDNITSPANTSNNSEQHEKPILPSKPNLESHTPIKTSDQSKPRPNSPPKNSRSNGNSTKLEKPLRADSQSAKSDKSVKSSANSRPPKQKVKLNNTSSRLADSYVPRGDRGVELTFAETGNIKVFMMVRGNAFIQLDGEAIPTFQLRLCREISFQFRTRLPHGLLVYHSVKNRPEGSPPYALYVIVEKGQLKVVHVFGKHLTSVTVGKGLNRDMWHSVTVRIDVHGARLLAKVDNESAEINLQGLHVSSNYGISTDLTSVVLIGGLSPEEKLHGVKYIIESFVGCIKDIILSAGKAASDLLPINPLIATKHENVQEGCINKCRTAQNLCFFGSKCVNHYSESTCDCFGTLYEGELCDIYTATILTLRGSSYVSYRVYDWKDRVHSSVNRVSLHFKTRFDDSALFYASGEHEKFHYISASIQNGTVVVEVDIGEGGTLNTTLGQNVNCNEWFNLTISHSYNVINVSLNDIMKTLHIEGSMNYLYIDPEIYIAGGPELHKKKGLKSNNYFAGSLKYVFFNEISILYELKKGSPKVHYIGLLEPEFGDVDVESIPLTFPFHSSHIWWFNDNYNSSGCLSLKFDFRSYKNLAVLAAAAVATESGLGYWEVRVVNEEVRFELVSNMVLNNTQLVTVKYDNTRNIMWHSIDLHYCNNELNLTIDYKHKTNHIFGLRFNLSKEITVGSGINGKTNVGLIGCLRNITINDKLLEPRYIVRTNHMFGQVAIDNCQLVDPCKRPNACKHGGKCSIKDDKVHCDCSGTGYIGKNCHFAQFKKTCEELALLGYTKPDVYLIDIDGNGRFPPAHVKCEFQSLEDWKTKTIVEHNLPSQIDVRSSAETDFSFTIKYREFTSEMLSELISHSLNCSQHIKYDCFKAPLELHSATWFISAAQQGTVDYIGNVKRGSCPCAENRTCVDPDLSCNCDVSEEKWLSDEGFFITPSSLGITKMVFLQQKDLDKTALGRITLGPLECVEANTQRYVVTFTTSQSYIEVPGWRKGDIAFSFRTTGEKAILLYQPPIRQHYPSFMVVLTSDFELTFNFTLNTGDTREMEIKSQRRLNSGEWQKIWIDYNKHHVRFMINTDYQMVDLRPHEEFGPFEGSMFIGGAIDNLVVKGSVYPGLVGCFRGLVVNGEILDIYSYMSVHLSDIIKECKPKCDPNPCKNGAKCKELWNRFECVCENTWAYSGTYCEENINTGGMTLIIRESFLKKNYLLNNVSNSDKFLFANTLNKTTLLNIRTYDQNSLILYVNDHLNNFVQLYIYEGKTIVLLYNYGNEIKNVSVEYPGLNNGKSIQLAIIRTEDSTTLHVNELNNSLPFGVKLLNEYSNKPWINPHLEVLSPQRPPAQPTEYLQVNIGGYDPYNLLSVNNHTKLEGYVGCIRGLKIGNNVTELIKPSNNTTNNTDIEGILVGCRMKCDEQPCKNQGICIEDFQKGESKCDCEHTSYYGEHCALEKGADFSGESVLQRKFVLEGPVTQIKVQLAFSSSDKREKKTALLLLQTENMRSYYLLVALGAEGELIIEEDREGSIGAYGIHIKDRSFLNGARHSVYYKRIENTTTLLVDREAVSIGPIPFLSFSNDDETREMTVGDNEVQIGGVNTSDPRFGSYKSYSGCLSNVFIEVNNNSMKPLDEYMLFTKAGSEKVNITNSQGVRSAQCAFFDVMHKPQSGPSLNISFAEEQAWVEDPPERVQYTSLYADTSEEEESASRIIFILSSSILVILIVSVMYHSYITHLKWKRRKEQETEMEIRRSKRQSLQYQESVLSTPLIVVSYKQSMSHEDDTKRAVMNGVDSKPAINKNDYKQTLTVPPTKYHKLADKDDGENEIREYKEKDRTKIIRNRNRNDRDLMYESIEEVAETHEEVANELYNGDLKKAVEIKEVPNLTSNHRTFNEINVLDETDLMLYKKYKINGIINDGDSLKNYNIDEMGSVEFNDNPYS